jgi:hypothetical protein
MTWKCDWPGCTEETDSRLESRWCWGGIGNDLVPGLCEEGIVCRLHHTALNMLDHMDITEVKAWIEACKRFKVAPFLIYKWDQTYWIEAPDDFYFFLPDRDKDLDALKKQGNVRGPFDSEEEAVEDMHATLMA